MSNPLIPFTLALTTVPFAFYKMEEFNTQSGAESEINYYDSLFEMGNELSIPLLDPDANSCYNYFYFNNYINYILIHNNSTCINFILPKDYSVAGQPCLIKTTQKVPGKDEEKKEFVEALLKKENELNLTYYKTQNDSLLASRIPLYTTVVFTAPSGVEVSHKRSEEGPIEKVILKKDGESINLQKALVGYYKNKIDFNNKQMAQARIDSKFKDSKDKAVYDMGQAVFDIDKNHEILDRLKGYRINGLYAVIEDELDTILFGTAKPKNEDIFAEDILWITKIRGTLSTLFNIQST